MKTIVTTIVMLMAIACGTLEASGQSARRNGERESTRRSSSAVRNETKKVKPVTREPRNRSSNAVRQVPSHNIKANKSRSGDQFRRRNNRDQIYSKSTRHNPSSDYRRSNRTVHTGKTYKNPRPASNGTRVVHKKQHNNTVGHARTVYHEHKYYPRHKVKVHVHPRTYHHHYRALYYPRHTEIVWSRRMHRYYVDLYPNYRWHYNWGHRIQTISVFDASYNVGEISRVYGRVYGTWYNRRTDDLLLFFGGEFPYQEFTMVIPGNIARRYAWRPEKFFLGQHVVATGLITHYEGKPEMVVKRKRQLEVY